MISFKEYLNEAAKKPTMYDEINALRKTTGSVETAFQNGMINHMAAQMVKDGFFVLDSYYEPKEKQEKIKNFDGNVGVVLTDNKKEIEITYFLSSMNDFVYLGDKVTKTRVASSEKLVKILAKNSSLPVELLKSSKITVNINNKASPFGEAKAGASISIKIPRELAIKEIAKFVDKNL